MANNWVCQDTLLGVSSPFTGPDNAAVSASGNTNYGPLVKPGTIKRFEDQTGKYGAGEFIYLPGVTNMVAGSVVNYVISAGVTAATDATVTLWTGGANSGDALAVATVANTSTTTWSWYQVQGAAVVNTTFSVAAGDKAYYGGSAGFWQSTAVGGKQVIGAKATSANGVPVAGQAVYLIDFPNVQSQIT